MNPVLETGMAELSSWLDGNWFNLIQTVGIIGSLLLATAAAQRDSKSRDTENLLTLANYHRELWDGVSKKEELKRVFMTGVDVQKDPESVEEAEFLNLAIVHFQTGWRLAKSGGLVGLDEMMPDLREFFSLPLPRAVWEKTKSYRNPKFVGFVENALK